MENWISFSHPSTRLHVTAAFDILTTLLGSVIFSLDDFYINRSSSCGFSFQEQTSLRCRNLHSGFAVRPHQGDHPICAP